MLCESYQHVIKHILVGVCLSGCLGCVVPAQSVILLLSSATFHIVLMPPEYYSLPARRMPSDILKPGNMFLSSFTLQVTRDHSEWDFGMFHLFELFSSTT